MYLKAKLIKGTADEALSARMSPRGQFIHADILPRVRKKIDSSKNCCPVAEIFHSCDDTGEKIRESVFRVPMHR